MVLCHLATFYIASASTPCTFVGMLEAKRMCWGQNFVALADTLFPLPYWPGSRTGLALQALRHCRRVLSMHLRFLENPSRASKKASHTASPRPVLSVETLETDFV